MNKLNFKKINFLLVIILFAMFASIFSLQKKNLDYADPFFLIGFRMFFAGIFILSYFFYKNSFLFFKFKHFCFFVFLSIFNIYLTNICELWGLNNTSSSKACMIYSLSPFMTAIISFFILNEKLSIKKITGLFFGFLGIMPIILFKTYEEYKIINFSMFSLSEILLFFSVFFSVIGWIFLKKIIELGYSFVFANGFSMFIGGFLILLHSFFSGESWNPLPIFDIKNFLFYTFITCLISNIICYNLFGYLLKFFSTTFMTFSGLMTPFFAIFFGWFFLNEPVVWYFFISIFLFFFGLFIFYREENKTI